MLHIYASFQKRIVTFSFKVMYELLELDSGGQSTQIKYLSKSTDRYNKILLQ